MRHPDESTRVDEALARLKLIADRPRRDEEVAHVDADAVLLWLINEPEVTEAFESIPKWYA